MFLVIVMITWFIGGVIDMSVEELEKSLTQKTNLRDYQVARILMMVEEDEYGAALQDEQYLELVLADSDADIDNVCRIIGDAISTSS